MKKRKIKEYKYPYDKNLTPKENIIEFCKENDLKENYSDSFGTDLYRFKDDKLEIVMHNAYEVFKLFIDNKKNWSTEGKCPICSWDLPTSRRSFNELILALNYLVANPDFSNNYGSFEKNKYKVKI